MYSLLGTHCCKQGKYIFNKTYYRDDPEIKDHVIDNKILVPGVCQIELVRQAVATLYPSFAGYIRRVMWLRPIVLENERQDIVLELNSHNDSFKITIDDRVYTRGKYVIEAYASGNDIEYNIDTIKSRMSHIYSREEVYSLFKKKGLSYGDMFQGVQCLYANAHETFSCITISDINISNVTQYSLHPTLMDAALQTVIGMERDEDDTILPFSIEVFYSYKEVTRDRTYYAHATQIEVHPQTNSSFYDIMVLNNQGIPVIEIRRFCLKHIKRKTGDDKKHSNIKI